jgi:hypothetical protein
VRPVSDQKYGFLMVEIDGQFIERLTTDSGHLGYFFSATCAENGAR